MKEIINKNQCVGCTACTNVCPKKAISIKEDSRGFKYPIIAEKKCINCGLCKKTCPVLNKIQNDSLNMCYVGFNKDEKSLIQKASSGSIFELLAKEVLNENGIVIGAAFDERNKLNHMAIYKEKDLIKLKGSKYLQSDLNNIFELIKENIKNKKILFVGTPCQVAGLKSYIMNDLDNLLCIDIVCHGVPSPKLYDKYVKELEIENNDKLVDYNFRDKSTGWDTYSNTAVFKNKQITELQSKNIYMKLFLSDIALRDSCHECNFKLGNKYSDITLGDFWGVKNYYPDMYNKNGVSAIIINTEKGNYYFKKITKEITYKDCKIEEILAGNPSLKTSSKLKNNKNLFFEELDKKSIDYLCNKYAKLSLKCKVSNKIKNMIPNNIKSKIKKVMKRK